MSRPSGPARSRAVLATFSSCRTRRSCSRWKRQRSSGLFSAGKPCARAPALLLSGCATRLLGHALTRRSQTRHRVPLTTLRGTLLHDQ